MIKKPVQFFLPLRAKLILIFLALIIMPFLISGFITYSEYIQSIENSSKVYSNQLTAQISMNVDKYVEEVDRLTILPLYESNIISILKKHISGTIQENYIPSSESLSMRLFLSSISFNRPEIRGMFIISNDGAIFSSLDETSYINFKGDRAWLMKAMKQGRDVLLLPPHLPEYYINNKDRVFSIIRAIRDPYDSKFLGVIKIDLTQKVFDKAIFSSNFTNDSKLYVTDQQGHIFYPGEALGEQFNTSASERIKIEGINYIVASKMSDYTGLNIIGIIDERQFQKDAMALINFTLVISIVSIFLAIVMAVFFSNSIVKPVQHLKGKMKKIQAGNFKERAEIFRNDEIGSLAEGFNVMVSEINRLVMEVYETQLRERDAELSALQSQINPHFLYNTFELVNMIAIENDQFEISDIVSSLGKLLRYTVEKKERPVRLREEIHFIEAYLKIFSIRYGDRLRTQIIIDPSLESCLVPKLIIQPLVENAIQHGIKDNSGKIVIVVEGDNEYLYISVIDDGEGINEAQLKALKGKIYVSDSYNGDMEAFGAERNGYALRNIHQRLRILYGEGFGLSIGNTSEEGCEFTLKLPRITTNKIEGV